MVRPSSLAKPRGQRPRSPSPGRDPTPVARAHSRSPTLHPQVVSFASQLTEDASYDAKKDVALPVKGSAAEIGMSVAKAVGGQAATDVAGRGKAVLTPRLFWVSGSGGRPFGEEPQS